MQQVTAFMPQQKTTAPFIILFDGVCNLCAGSVQFILKHDTQQQFHFGTLQGAFGQQVLQQQGLPAADLQSFILLEGSTIYTRSTAALRVLKHLGGGWRLLYAFILVPEGVRDVFYKLIARNRYKWFGKKTECWLPKPEWKERFLS